MFFIPNITTTTQKKLMCPRIAEAAQEQQKQKVTLLLDNDRISIVLTITTLKKKVSL